MYKAIAMGKVASNGTILKASPGISVSTQITQGTGPDLGYTVTLPDRLVKDQDYIVQLTPANYEENQDFTLTTIAIRYQSVNSFEVIIWGDRSQPNRFGSVRSAFHFVIYDLC